MVNEGLVDNAATVGEVLQKELQKMVSAYSIVGSCHGKGLVAGLQIVIPGTTTPDKHTANKICQRIIEKGIMLFAPVGKATIKIAPPLIITEDAVEEGCMVIADAIGEIQTENEQAAQERKSRE